jgi:hypothetical protein
LNIEPFLQVVHRELSQPLGGISASLRFVKALPEVNSGRAFADMYLCGDRYWLPWGQEVGVWIQSDGCSVDIFITEHSNDTNLESSLTNFMTAVVLGACLNLQGRIAIHANSVALEGLAAAFVGYSGRGKSTLTAYCLTQGAEFVTDDVLTVASDGMVHSGCPRLKLYPHTGQGLGLPATEDTDYKIHYHPAQLGGLVKEESIPLGVIYLLEESLDNRIYSEQLSPSEAVFALLTHSYYASHLIPQNPALLDAYVRLITQVPVKKLFYPRIFSMLPEVYSFLLEEVRKL